MLMGIPGSGKSRLALNIQKKWPEKQYNILSTDDIFIELGKVHGWSYNDAFNRIRFNTVETIFYDRYTEFVADRKNIIIDQVNVTQKTRQKKLNYLTPDYVRVGIYVDTPMDEIRERLELRFMETGKEIPDEVIQRMIASFQMPTLIEFHHLFCTSKLTGVKDLFV
jgi:predicted kinase